MVLMVGEIILILACLSYATSDASRQNYMEKVKDENHIQKRIKCVRSALERGVPHLGIPSLKSLELDSVTINVNSSFLKNNLHFGTLHIDGLTKFASDIITPHKILLRFETISIRGDYKFSGNLLSLIQTYHKGYFGIEMNSLTTTIDIYPALVVEKVLLPAGKVKVEVSGLVNDEPLSSVISTALSELITRILHEYRQLINEIFSPIITNIVNVNIIEKFKLSSFEC